MQPISIIILVIIIITFIYSFFDYRSKEKKNREIEKPIIIKNKDADLYKVVIAALVAVVMENKKHKIKNIVLSGKGETVSSWRIFGRQELMRRRQVV